MERTKIDVNGGVTAFIVQLGEDNPGALSVITRILEKDPTMTMIMIDLEDMNIRGYQIWLGFKDYCKEDLDLFINAINSRDKQMIQAINIESARMAYSRKLNKENYLNIPKAVPGEASYEDPSTINLTEDEIFELKDLPKPIHPQANLQQERF